MIKRILFILLIVPFMIVSSIYDMAQFIMQGYRFQPYKIVDWLSRKLNRIIIMSKSKEYKAIKNYIHNELKLTKEDIREIMIPIIREEVKRVFHNTYGNDVSLDNWIRCMVSNEIKCQGGLNMLWTLSKEAIKTEITDKYSIEVKLKEK